MCTALCIYFLLNFLEAQDTTTIVARRHQAGAPRHRATRAAVRWGVLPPHHPGLRNTFVFFSGKWDLPEVTIRPAQYGTGLSFQYSSSRADSSSQLTDCHQE